MWVVKDQSEKKWLYCFDDVSSVLFLAALDGYDMKLEEDISVNCLEESLNLFRDITSSGILQPASWILFLNKSDLFETKIKKFPLHNYFTDISPDSSSNFEECCKYIQAKYEKNFGGKKLFTFVTCGLDTTNCKKLFVVVRENTLSNFINTSF